MKNNLLVFFLLTLFAACSNDKYVPDVSDIELDVKIRRFEKDLFSIDTSNIASEVKKLQSEYDAFFNRIYLHIMRDETVAKEDPVNVVHRILSSEAVRELYDTCQHVFNDVSNIEKELSQAFKYYKYYLPERDVPEVISYISEYGLGNFTYGDSLLGIGWDFFLGENFPNYNVNVFPAYIQRTMNPENVAPKAIHAVCSNLAGEPAGRRLLDHMINNGKVLYIKSLFLPNMPDSLIMEYSTKEIQWVEKNEFEMWTHFMKEDLLYSTKMNDIRKLIKPSPNGPGGMPPETPGRVANWTGWQIIKAYMANQKAVNLSDLLAEKDAQKILDMAKYRPKR